MTDLIQLDRQKAEIISVVQSWPLESQNFHPGDQCWSATQILDHLARTEASILSTAESNLAEPHRIGIRDRIGVLFIERVFRSERRVKVPGSAVSILPTTNPHLSVILDTWNETRVHLHSFTENLTPDQSRGGLFRHPVGGWMSMRGIVSFFSVHIIHHVHQLTRIRAASNAV